jgi:hypothetical protein
MEVSGQLHAPAALTLRKLTPGTQWILDLIPVTMSGEEYKLWSSQSWIFFRPLVNFFTLCPHIFLSVHKRVLCDFACRHILSSFVTCTSMALTELIKSRHFACNGDVYRPSGWRERVGSPTQWCLGLEWMFVVAFLSDSKGLDPSSIQSYSLHLVLENLCSIRDFKVTNRAVVIVKRKNGMFFLVFCKI